nr:MAG TPA: hypothetical protein [Caudoviricetes sp.]
MAHLAFRLGRQQMAKGAQPLQLALDAGRAFQQQPGHGIDVGRALIFHAFGQQAQTVGQGGKIAFDVQQGGRVGNELGHGKLLGGLSIGAPQNAKRPRVLETAAKQPGLFPRRVLY